VLPLQPIVNMIKNQTKNEIFGSTANCRKSVLMRRGDPA